MRVDNTDIENVDMVPGEKTTADSSAHSSQTELTADFLSRPPDGAVLTCKGLAKQTRPGKEKGLHPVIVASFGEVELCPVACLRAYEAATEKFRIS